MYGFDPVSADLEIQNLVGINATLLNEAVTAHYYKELPFGVVPVLSLRDAWLADIDADLAAIQGMDKFCKGTAIVDIHLQRKGNLFLWKITQISTVEFLCKGVLWNLRNHQGLWLVGKTVDQVNDFTKSDFVGDRTITVAAGCPIGVGHDVIPDVLGLLNWNDI